MGGVSKADLDTSIFLDDGMVILAFYTGSLT